MNKNDKCCDIVDEYVDEFLHKELDISECSITCGLHVINGVAMGVFYGGYDMDNSGIHYIRYNIMYKNDVVYDDVYSKYDNININNILYNIDNYMVNNHGISIYDCYDNNYYCILFINKYIVYNNDDEMVIQISIRK